MARARWSLPMMMGVAAFAAFGARAKGPPTPEPGKFIAQQANDHGAAPYTSCHGAAGEGNADIGAPRLAALGTPYIMEQLDDFAGGLRKNELMVPIAQALSPAERQAVAAYFAALAPSKTDPATAAGGPLGARLALRGRWSAQLPGCVQCHGPAGSGVAPAFPSLAGLPQPYIVAQLQAWKTNTRPPGPLGLMAAVAQKLSEDDMAAVAGYFASMAVPAPSAAQ